MATQFAVAAGNAATAEAAAEILHDGGGAIDAVIAAALMATVSEPVLASILGGGFLMAREPGRPPKLLDFFVQTPKRKLAENDLDFREVHADFGEARQAFHIGAGAIATPGVARGLFEAHRAWTYPLSGTGSVRGGRGADGAAHLPLSGSRPRHCHTNLQGLARGVDALRRVR